MKKGMASYFAIWAIIVGASRLRSWSNNKSYKGQITPLFFTMLDISHKK